jgi:integrase
MARGINKLSGRTIANAKQGRHGDGGGLYLIVSETGAKRWAFRFTFNGKVTELGLGPAGAVSLADARDRADAARRLVAAGRNPIEAKRETARVAAGRPTFGQCADEFIEAKSPEWRNAKHRAQWRTTLGTYAAPLRSLPVDKIDTEAVKAILKPLWARAPETASRLRGRIESILDAAKAQGHRSGENPAAWRGNLSHFLPKRNAFARDHHAALPFVEVPALVARLRKQKTISALALEFCILTAGRSGEVLGARWDEFDLAAKVWTIPPARMKAKREHRVPLPGRAMGVLGWMKGAQSSEFVFPGRTADKPLSTGAFAALLKRMQIDDVTVHGFRSTFRDWCGEATNFPRELAELALAHAVGSAVERAYRRADALEKRRELMQAWADFIEPRPPVKRMVRP